MSVLPGIYPIAKLLPKRFKKFLAPFYYRFQIILGNNVEIFDYNGELLEVYYTLDTASQFRELIEDGKMRSEGIPLDYLDCDPHLDAFVDIGAHFGTYSVIGSRLNPEAEIYSFEPNDYNRSVLKTVLEENNISAEIRSEVVAGHSGTRTFYVDESTGSQSHTIHPTEGFTKRNIESISLSDFFSKHNFDRIFTKIDAEGGEAEILKDITSLEQDLVIEGIVEFHPDKTENDVGDIISNFSKYSDNFEFIIDHSPTHPQSHTHNHKRNRPTYYFKLKSDCHGNQYETE